LPAFLTIALLAGAWGIFSAKLHAAEPNEAPQKPVVAQRLFASPDEAIKALQAATEAKDKAALREIFGPEYKELSPATKCRTRTMRRSSPPPWRRAAIR
jgi:uncharacterized iron-regulated membrane protein